MTGYSRRRFLVLSASSALPVLYTQTGRLHRLLRPKLEQIAAKLATCSREAAFPTALGFVRDGATWEDILGATLLVGTREVSPQPIGNNAHAIMMIWSSFQLAASTKPDQRLLPVLFNLDYIKRSQHRDRGWKLPPRPEGAKLEPKQARELFHKCMRGWDEAGSDRAVVNLYGHMEQDDLFELVWPWALRDFRFIGHKPIYTAAIYRAMKRVGWKHGLPLLRSLVLGLLDGHGHNRAWTRTFTSNGKLAGAMKVDWAAGKPDPGVSMKLLSKLRSVGVNDAGPMVVELLGQGTSPGSIWDGLRLYAAEILAQQRGIAGVHLTTSINALHFIWKTTRREQTRRLAILQAASWMPMFRDDFTKHRGVRLGEPNIDALIAADEAPAPGKILDVGPADRATAVRQVLCAASGDSTETLEECFRQLAFRKGSESHIYKYSAAMLEEFHHAHPDVAPRILAAGVYYLPLGKQPDAEVYTRARTLMKPARSRRRFL